MTYPPTRYTGDSGEISATYRPAGAPPDLEIGAITAVRYLATGASTNGEFGLYRWDMGPQRAGAATHFHRTISESFFILTGQVRIFNGAGWIDAAPGDFVHVPPGGIHAFRNESGEPASMLLLFTPGAPREGYFERLADAARGRRLSPEELQRLYIEHDNVMLPDS